jgi:hypothetical protein
MRIRIQIRGFDDQKLENLKSKERQESQQEEHSEGRGVNITRKQGKKQQ